MITRDLLDVRAIYDFEKATVLWIEHMAWYAPVHSPASAKIFSLGDTGLGFLKNEAVQNKLQVM